ncbi:MAG: hypothetical protein ACXACR_16685, partial [Candidatus Hodarchaeales archaeon]
MNIQMYLTELMVEELGNFGLDINVIQDIMKESQKFLDNGDIEAAEVLVKNSKIFASNLWLEHRMNLISTTISFIDTFILNQAELELDFKNANKYFTQAQEFLTERDLTLANKYLDNTIQNAKKSWNSLRKMKLREALKFAKYWLKELGKLEVDITKLQDIIRDAQKAYLDNDLDKTEYYLDLIVDSSGTEVEDLELDVDQKEDYIQGMQGVYDRENFSTLGEAISKAESMLGESQEKDKIQFQLNSLLNAYKIVFEIDNKGLDSNKVNDLFVSAKESFEKGDYNSSDKFVKKILALSRKLLESGGDQVTEEVQEEAIEEVDSVKEKKPKLSKKDKERAKAKSKRIKPEELSPEKKEVYDLIQTMKKDIEYIKTIKKTGEKLVRAEEMLNNLESDLKREIIDEILINTDGTRKLVLELKKEVLEKKAHDTMDSTLTMLTGVQELGVNVEDAEQGLRSANEHIQKQEYKAAINDAVQSQQIMELKMEKHQTASDKLLKTKLFMDKILKDAETPEGIDVLYAKAEQLLTQNDYRTLKTLSDFIYKQVKLTKNKETIDTDTISKIVTIVSGMDNYDKSIAELKSQDISSKEVEKIHKNLLSTFNKQNFDDSLKFCEDEESIFKKLLGNEELDKLKTELNDSTEELIGLEKDGYDVIAIKAKLEQLNELIDANELESAKKLKEEISNDITELKTGPSKEEEQNIIGQIEEITEQIAKAKSDRVQTKEVEDLINYAKLRLKSGNFSEV